MKTKFKKRYILLAVVILLAILLYFILNKRGKTDIVVPDTTEQLTVTSPAFEHLGVIPQKHTGKGEDISPALYLSELSDDAVSIAVIMDDLDIPVVSNYNHWVIWNIPVQNTIPEGVLAGDTVPTLGNAMQGIGYGEHTYKGPEPPFGTHRYQYHVFVLDTMLELDSSSKKEDLVNAIDGHILQYGSLTGWYPKEKN